LEIRRLVYQQVLGGESILLQVTDENKRPEESTARRRKVAFRLTCPGARSLLSLPASCKTAYVIRSTE
jgi:hypothetical protein